MFVCLLYYYLFLYEYSIFDDFKVKTQLWHQITGKSFNNEIFSMLVIFFLKSYVPLLNSSRK